MTNIRLATETQGSVSHGRALQIELQQFKLDDITPTLLTELEGLYDQAYPNSSMHAGFVEDMAQKPDIFRLFTARNNRGLLLGARTVQLRPDEPDDHLGFEPVYGKRFAVSPEARGRSIGRILLSTGKQYCFNELGLKVMFGSSYAIGALSMYGREGALYHADPIFESIP